jgi:hypothetical protein
LPLASHSSATRRNAHPKGGIEKALAAKQTQHHAADALFRAITETLNKNRQEGSLIGQVLEELARAYGSVATTSRIRDG